MNEKEFSELKVATRDYLNFEQGKRTTEQLQKVTEALTLLAKAHSERAVAPIAPQQASPLFAANSNTEPHSSDSKLLDTLKVLNELQAQSFQKTLMFQKMARDDYAAWMDSQISSSGDDDSAPLDPEAEADKQIMSLLQAAMANKQPPQAAPSTESSGGLAGFPVNSSLDIEPEGEKMDVQNMVEQVPDFYKEQIKSGSVSLEQVKNYAKAKGIDEIDAEAVFRAIKEGDGDDK